MVSRKEWGAVGSVPVDGSAKWRIGIHHTVSPNRLWTKAQEMEHVRQIERQHISQGWSTVGYSFLIFPSGRVYVGRGWAGLPAAQGGQNSGSWAIAFVLNGDLKAPSVLARRKARQLIGTMKEKGARRLGGHGEFPDQATACPGAKTQPYVVKWRDDFNLAKP
jgi:hypothetical protein